MSASECDGADGLCDDEAAVDGDFALAPSGGLLVDLCVLGVAVVECDCDSVATIW